MVPSAARGLWDWPPLNPQMGRDFVNKWEEGSVRCPQRWEPGSVAWSVASAASTQLSFGDFLLRDLCSPALPEPDPPPPLTMGSMHFVLAVPSLICVKLCRLWCCCWPWHAPAQLPLTLLHCLLLSTTPRSSFFSSHTEQTAHFSHSLHGFCYLDARSCGLFLPVSSHSASPMSTAGVLGQAFGGPCMNTGWHYLNTRAILTWGHLEV